MTSIERAQTITDACMALTSTGPESASRIIESEYPHIEVSNAGRKYTEAQSIEVFLHDGFIDRFSGTKLIFPPVLRLLSLKLPQEFPFHRNWKMSECHIAYWELFPTVDHLVPVARGGPDESSNWVTTSMLHNGAKSNRLVEELQWTLHPPGESSEWDGLMNWFMNYADENPDILDVQYIKRWHRAARKVLGQ